MQHCFSLQQTLCGCSLWPCHRSLLLLCCPLIRAASLHSWGLAWCPLQVSCSCILSRCSSWLDSHTAALDHQGCMWPAQERCSVDSSVRLVLEWRHVSSSRTATIKSSMWQCKSGACWQQGVVSGVLRVHLGLHMSRSSSRWHFRGAHLAGDWNGSKPPCSPPWPCASASCTICCA